MKAKRADTRGNLEFWGTAMNFNPEMAMAADRTIVEVRRGAELLSSGGGPLSARRLRR